MNRAERIFRLHGLLKQQRPVSMRRLREEMGASRSTITRDVEYMRDFMGAPIVYNRGANSYAYDPSVTEFELPGFWFNASELYALLASEQLLESVQPGLLTPYIGPLRARIRKLLEQSGHRADTVTARISILSVGARRIDSDQFGAAAQAVLEGRVLDLTYKGRERNEITRRRVHPHQLIHYRNNWYLIARCEQAQELRTFALDRILGAEQSEDAAQEADVAALDRYLRASFGIFTGPAQEWAVLRFSPRMARWVADETWHPDQIGQWQGEQYELQIPYSDPRELMMDILKYGPEVEVVAPEELRTAVAERLTMAAEVYGG